MDKNEVRKVVKQYADVVTQELSPVSIVLYGSHAKGNPHKDSDIDVAVIFHSFVGDWLQTSTQLWKLRHNISLDIEPILLDRATDPSGFVRNIYKTGEVIYGESFA